MTSVRIQPVRKKHIINIGCYDGLKVRLGNITERYIALYVHKTLFCLIWISKYNSFNKATEELKLNFKFVFTCISDNYVKSCIKFEYYPWKVHSQITNMVLYDIETFNTDGAVP